MERLPDEGGKGGGQHKRYSEEEQGHIVDLMNKFELCYELDDQTIVVPDVLGEKEPTEGLPESAGLRFYFEYDFMPALVMPRFMVKSGRDLDTDLCWRTGAVLKNDSFKSTAGVRQDKHQGRIYVEVSGGQARDYFATIRRTILEINDSFENLDVTEWVPLPGEEGQAVKYLDLIGHEVGGRGEKFVGELGKGYRVAELLGGVESREETQVHIEKFIEEGGARVDLGKRTTINAGDKSIIAAEGGIVNIKVEQAIGHLEELERVLEKQAKGKLSATVKKKGLEIVHDALKDVAKRQLSEAAKKIWELGKEVGPAILGTAGYKFFTGMR